MKKKHPLVGPAQRARFAINDMHRRNGRLLYSIETNTQESKLLLPHPPPVSHQGLENFRERTLQWCTTSNISTFAIYRKEKMRANTGSAERPTTLLRRSCYICE